jgi:hypothetical protein
MGQYYKAIILAEKTGKKEYIRISFNPPYNEGMKLMEHSYINNSFVGIIEYLISPEGMFYKSRLVWAGDYANTEEDSDKNLYFLAKDEDEEHFPNIIKKYFSVIKKYNFIINHTKKEYITKENKIIHPLPLLTVEGNGEGGGDYYGKNINLVGSWARDVISINNSVPDDYKEIIYNFDE